MDASGLWDEKGEATERAKQLDAISLRQYLSDAGTGTAPWLVKTLDIAFTCEYGLETDRQCALNLIDLISTDTREGCEMLGDSNEAHRGA